MRNYKYCFIFLDCPLLAHTPPTVVEVPLQRHFGKEIRFAWGLRYLLSVIVDYRPTGITITIVIDVVGGTSDCRPIRSAVRATASDTTTTTSAGDTATPATVDGCTSTDSTIAVHRSIVGIPTAATTTSTDSTIAVHRGIAGIPTVATAYTIAVHHRIANTAKSKW